MKKQKVQLVILLVSLVALAAVYFGIKQYNRLQAEEPAEIVGENIINGTYEDVIRFSYEYEGESCAFEKEGDNWYVTADHSLEVKQYKIQSMLEGIIPLIAKQTIENTDDFEQYGLGEGRRTITLETEETTYTLYVGDYNSVTGNYYVGRLSDTAVYVVARAAVSGFDVSLDELVEEAQETEDTTTDGTDSAS